MRQIFKKGDRVFCIMAGWGIVTGINVGEYPISVAFNDAYYTYSEDGRVNHHAPPTLSFTEYTLEGFSQERPEPLPKRGDVVWGKNFDEDNWHIGHFYLFDKSSVSLKYCISSNPAGNKNLWVQEITTTNPYANEQ